MEWAWEALTSPHYIHGNLFFFEFFPFPHKTKKVLFSFPLPSPKSTPQRPIFSPQREKKNQKSIFFFEKISFFVFFRIFYTKILTKHFNLGGFFYLQKKIHIVFTVFLNSKSPPSNFVWRLFDQGPRDDAVQIGEQNIFSDG